MKKEEVIAKYMKEEGIMERYFKVSNAFGCIQDQNYSWYYKRAGELQKEGKLVPGQHVEELEERKEFLLFGISLAVEYI